MRTLGRHLAHPARKCSAFTLVIVAALGIALCCSISFAQNSSSGINGIVVDPSGAAVPGAKIALKNVNTNVERNTVSNGTGDYFFTNVPPARYVLTVSAAGFTSETISSFEVGVAQVVTINIALKIGNVSQSVTV